MIRTVGISSSGSSRCRLGDEVGAIGEEERNSVTKREAATDTPRRTRREGLDDEKRHLTSTIGPMPASRFHSMGRSAR